jgi:hypothetical protein
MKTSLSFIYRNNSREINKYHYFGAILKGDTGNLYAIGSRITVHAGGQLLYREFVPSRGFQSSMDYKQIIGIGSANKIDSVVIQWPDLMRYNINKCKN